MSIETREETVAQNTAPAQQPLEISISPDAHRALFHLKNLAGIFNKYVPLLQRDGLGSPQQYMEMAKEVREVANELQALANSKYSLNGLLERAREEKNRKCNV